MQAWNDFLKEQEKELGIDTVERWLRTLKVLSYDACNLQLEARDAFQVIWFEEHIRKKITTALVNNNDKQIKVHIQAANKLTAPLEKKKGGKAPLDSPSIAPFSIDFHELDPFCSLDNFVPSEGNLLSYKLLCKVTNYDPISKKIIPSEKELAAFNPIYLFGGEGTGKTHLLMATAHALNCRKLKVVYVRAETFTEHVVTAIRAGEMSTFRQAYRNIDVLLIDDVHVFSRKGATQEELFHTFNALHLSGKQIILSANCSPQELQYIEPRLISRFEWGIVLPQEPPPPEDVQKILKKKTEALNFPLHPKIEEFLLQTFTNSPKTLTRALEALILRHHMKHEQERRAPTPLTVPIARHLLKDLLTEEQLDALTAEKIVKAVSEYYGIKQEDILSKAQNRECVIPRQLAMYFCRTKLKTPYTKIGDFFTRDHSTVMSSVKLVKNGITENEKEIVGAYNWILKKLNK